MKTILTILFVCIIFSGYAQDNSSINNKIIIKSQVVDFIQKMEMKGKITKDPVLVLDENIILELDSIQEDKEFWGELTFIEKGEEEMTAIYGAKALNGIVFLTSPPEQESSHIKSKIYFLVGDKPISEEELKVIDPNNIESVTVIKKKEEIAKYTNEEYDGVVIIEMKKAFREKKKIE